MTIRVNEYRNPDSRLIRCGVSNRNPAGEGTHVHYGYNRFILLLNRFTHQLPCLAAYPPYTSGCTTAIAPDSQSNDPFKRLFKRTDRQRQYTIEYSDSDRPRVVDRYAQGIKTVIRA